MSQIKDIIAKIEGLKIPIYKAAIIDTLNNFNSYFQTYLPILNHNAWEKEKLLILCKLTKVLKDEQLCFSNKNRGKVYNAHSFKSKKAKSSGQKKKEKQKKVLTMRKIKKARNVRV